MKRLWNARPIRFMREMVELYFSARVSHSAAALAYFLVLSFFPILICINAFVGALHLEINSVLAVVERFLPAGVANIVAEYVQYITVNQSVGMFLAGLLVTLISASAGVRILMKSMENIYERRGYRGFWSLVASVVFAFLLLVTMYLSMVVVLTGSWFSRLIETYLHLPIPITQWQWVRFVLLFALVLFVIALLYRFTAPRGEPRPPVLTGAILASIALAAASILFSWFMGMSTRYSLVYGSLASVIILMAWLYLCGNILILGSVFNCVWYRHKKEKCRK